MDLKVNDIIFITIVKTWLPIDDREVRMAPRAGLEPATKRLTAACSTTELPGNKY